jgi:serine/threonine-protein kinase
VARFEREAQAASQLRVPHSIQIFDFGATEDGIYYIAMEYLVGTDLNTLVRERGALPPDQVIRFAIQICASLEEAHRAGIIHRDVKPQNLFAARVGADEEFIKLLDFGIARLRTLTPDEAQLTRTGQLTGTPAYLAPELWYGAEADERTDIYALGVTLYFLLTGVTPSERGTPSALMAGEPPALSTVRSEPVPPELERLVLRCLARNPEDRVQSAVELRVALEAISAETPA